MGLGPVTRGEFIARTAISFSLLANWCAFDFGYQLIRERQSTALRAAQAESLALRNELKHLQLQISPHFLRNALNTVLACRRDPDAIESVMQALASYLDFLLRPAEPLEPLARELDALEDYLTIQALRFGDDLQAGIDCDRAARGVPVPAVMVQLLVEILWVEAFRNYTRVRLTGRTPLLVRRTMSEWAALLPAPPFGRIDRSLIINLAAIKSTQWQSRHQTLLVFRGAAEPLPVGRAATQRLKTLLQD